MKILSNIGLFFLGIFLLVIGNIGFSADWNLPGVTIISRAEWGADETIRFRSTPRPITKTSTGEKTEAQIKAENISKIRNAWMAKNYPLEWKYESSNMMFGNHYLIYPDYYNHHKNKIVIHHTAVDYDPDWTIDDVKHEIQQIYKYHTINRDFGDIGYNFLIDQMGNIYEGRAGGEGAVGMHAANNNVTSIGICLMGNFQNDIPTVEQMKSLVNLTTAVAKYYHIDPHGYSYTFFTNTEKEPYVVAEKNPNIMGHKNVKSTACPGTNLYKYLPQIRDEVLRRMKRGIVGDDDLPTNWSNELKKSNNTYNQSDYEQKQVIINSNSEEDTTPKPTILSKRIITLRNEKPYIIQSAAQAARKTYKGKLNKATNKTSKIIKKYSINDVKKMLNQDISVLLYELSTEYDSFQISCDMKCIFNIDGVNYNRTGATLTFLTNKIQVNSDHILSANTISVKSSMDNGVVKISNYNRKSYLGIPWNIFKGSLNFEKGYYSLRDGKEKSGFIVTNTLSFSEYMKGIVETNDTETLEKNKVMAMIAKNYALFYLNRENIHPNIPKEANYTVIDDPDFFQKYVGAGLEKTLTKWYQALEVTKDFIVMYDNYLPILPYFNCSAGFTLSAEEKRGWNDTPYLKSVYDFDYCSDFVGHGVGLAGKGAERLAKQGMTYDQILEYYYDNIEIKKIN